MVQIITDLVAPSTGNGVTIVGDEEVFVAASGQVIAAAGYGINGTDDGIYMTVAGSVYGDLGGIRILADDDPFFSGVTVITATGSVLSNDAAAISLREATHTTINDGYISGRSGIDFVGNEYDLTNRGVITAIFGEGLSINADRGLIRNYGTISSNGNTSAGIELTNGLETRGSTARVENFGTILGEDISINGFGDSIDVANFGQLSGAVSGSTTSDTVENAGVIYGNVALGSGNDQYTSDAGLVTGTIDLGSGADTLRVVSFDRDSILNVEGGTEEDTADLSGLVAGVWFDGEIPGDALWTRDDGTASGGDWRIAATFSEIETITGTQGIDVLRGTDIDETFVYFGNEFLPGIDQYDGRDGVDTVDFSMLASAVWVDLDYGSTEAWTRDSDTFFGGGTFRAIADLDNIENIVGTAGVDYVRGTDEDNVLEYNGVTSLVGVEDIDLRGGSDTVDFSNFGNAIWVDLNYTVAANVQTQDQNDLAGGTWRELANIVSVETVIATNFDDQLRGSNAADVLDGGAGDDLLIGRGGLDTFIFEDGDGNDQIQGFQTDDGERIDLRGAANITNATDLFANHIGVNAMSGFAQIEYGSDTIELVGYFLGDIGVGQVISEDDFILTF